MSSSPQSMREALIAELIGDVDKLITRTEELKSTLPDQLKVASRTTTGELTAAGEKLRNDFLRDLERVKRELQQTAAEAKEAAQIVHGSARRFAVLAMAAGLFAGALGGLIAGLLAANYILGA